MLITHKGRNKEVKIVALLMSCMIQPWLSVRHSKKALDFYKEAFDALETYFLDTGNDTIVAKLSIEGAEFWLSEGSPDLNPQDLNQGNVRMILITQEPERLFNQALSGGASQVYPIGQAHGWKLGRIADPFGHHWEIGHPVS